MINNLFQTISNFFVAVSTSVLVFVGAQEPVNVPQIQGVEAVEVAATPEPTIFPMVSPTPDMLPPQTSTPTPIPKIVCIGPDGKSFNTSKKECDAFNAAWGNNPSAENNTTDEDSSADCLSKELPQELRDEVDSMNNRNNQITQLVQKVSTLQMSIKSCAPSGPDEFECRAKNATIQKEIDESLSQLEELKKSNGDPEAIPRKVDYERSKCFN